eukprot:10618905-Alexandrium_andersonii.AAC.1
MARFRYHLSRQKSQIRKEFGDADAAEKREWRRKWMSFKNFDFVVSRKTEAKTKKSSSRKS